MQQFTSARVLKHVVWDQVTVRSDSTGNKKVCTATDRASAFVSQVLARAGPARRGGGRGRPCCLA